MFSFLSAQNYTAIAPWDNALSYHPSKVGVHTDESFQMNIFSQQSILEDSLTRALLPSLRDLRDFIDFNVDLLEPRDVKNSYFLGYQKTAVLKRQNRITGGLQLQHIKEIERQTQNPTILGFTLNYHKPLAKKKYKTRYLSFGYQLNLLFNTPNRSVTPAAFSSIDTPRLSFDEFNAQFRNSGLNQSLSFNYFYLRENRTSIQLGLTFSFYNVKEPSRILSTIDGTVIFTNSSLFQGRAILDFQQMISNKLVLNINLLLQRSLHTSLGFGFRLKRHTILNLNIVQMYSESQFTSVSSPIICLLYTSPSPRDRTRSRMPSSA